MLVRKTTTYNASQSTTISGLNKDDISGDDEDDDNDDDDDDDDIGALPSKPSCNMNMIAAKNVIKM